MSRRTIFRDLETLRDAGIRLRYNRKAESYSMAEPVPLNVGDLSIDEATALVTLANQMGDDRHVPFFTAAGLAARKLSGSLPRKTRDQLHEVADAVTIVPQGVANLNGKRKLFGELLEARRQRRVLRMEYASLTEWETISTKLRPYQLMYCRHSWYVVGRSSIHREVRTFKLARITELEILDEEYRLPRGFSLKRYLKNAWRIVPEGNKDLQVVIRFSPLVATNVAEVEWHPTQQLALQPDGSLLFEATVSGLNEISWWILGYADQAEVLRPARLRKLVGERAANMAKIYDR
ncbi:hypothetical protein Pan181_47700 [Aeoliella mucimassa]|uniref:Uncharacterized protein n=1 Tax=Aeoliella mucimassa TaxID=2527972 RepID=A0A518AUZ7_9BACT|nr:hypothetical protein Pan181_47700 [Aeoliella mucimassa]